jgi:site-specific DNA-cytosine methylase
MLSDAERERFRCRDIDAKKGASYAVNWGAEHLKIGDLGALAAPDLPGIPDLAWASFPCQDLSLADDYVELKEAASKRAYSGEVGKSR